MTDTDGIETINYKLSEEYPEGIMIAQDGLNKDGYRTKRQNFKIVSFKDVLDALDVIRSVSYTHLTLPTTPYV